MPACHKPSNRPASARRRRRRGLARVAALAAREHHERDAHRPVGRPLDGSQWADRLFVGNALGWEPPQRFDHVRTGLEYVPGPRQRELVAWLVDRVVTPGGRLIFGTTNEARAEPELEPRLASWGYHIAGRSERPHRSDGVVYRVVWIDV